MRLPPRERHLVDDELRRLLQLLQDGVGHLVGVHGRFPISWSGRRRRLSTLVRPAPTEARRARNSAIVMSAGMSHAS